MAAIDYITRYLLPLSYISYIISAAFYKDIYIRGFLMVFIAVSDISVLNVINWWYRAITFHYLAWHILSFAVLQAVQSITIYAQVPTLSGFL